MPSKAKRVDIATIRTLTRERDAGVKLIDEQTREIRRLEAVSGDIEEQLIATRQERDEAQRANKTNTQKYLALLQDLYEAKDKVNTYQDRWQQARADLGHDEAVLLRQRELLIRLRAIAKISENAASKILLMQEHHTTRHDLYGSRCIVLGSDWTHAVAWCRALERAMVELAIDTATGTGAVAKSMDRRKS